MLPLVSAHFCGHWLFAIRCSNGNRKFACQAKLIVYSTPTKFCISFSYGMECAWKRINLISIHANAMPCHKTPTSFNLIKRTAPFDRAIQRAAISLFFCIGKLKINVDSKLQILFSYEFLLEFLSKYVQYFRLNEEREKKELDLLLLLLIARFVFVA